MIVHIGDKATINTTYIEAVFYERGVLHINFVSGKSLKVVCSDAAVGTPQKDVITSDKTSEDLEGEIVDKMLKLDDDE